MNFPTMHAMLTTRMLDGVASLMKMVKIAWMLILIDDDDGAGSDGDNGG